MINIILHVYTSQIDHPQSMKQVDENRQKLHLVLPISDLSYHYSESLHTTSCLLMCREKVAIQLHDNLFLTDIPIFYKHS